jgi:hypothetical protein
LVKNLFRRATHRREAILVTTITLILIAFYTYWTRNYGGWSVGFRWLIPVMPPLVLFLGVWVDGITLRPWKLGILAALFSVSAFSTQDAVSGPFQFSRWHNWLENAYGRNRTDTHTSKAAEVKRRAKKRKKASSKSKSKKR